MFDDAIYTFYIHDAELHERWERNGEAEKGINRDRVCVCVLVREREDRE